VLLREVRKQGYRGELTVVRDFTRTIKKEIVRRITERFERCRATRPRSTGGECWTIEVGGERRKL
jgi:hypothetical protein